MNSNETLLEAHKNANDDAKWAIPFPMSVFGTLRMHCGNNHLMGSKVGSPHKENSYSRYHENYKPPQFNSHHKAFLPHFYAEGLSLNFLKDASAVCEVFVYDDPEEWKKMIPSVDRLEGFHPGDHRDSYGYGYHRTLVKMHLLPDNFESNYYDSARDGLWRSGRRDFKIDPKEWSNYPTVAAWVYSSMRQNSQCRAAVTENNPIIWDG